MWHIVCIHIHTYLPTYLLHTLHKHNIHNVEEVFFQCTVWLSTKPRDHFRRYVFGAKFSNPKPWWRHHWFLCHFKIVFSPSYLRKKRQKRRHAVKNPPWLKEKPTIRYMQYMSESHYRHFFMTFCRSSFLDTGDPYPCFRTPQVPQADWQLWSTTITGGFWDATIG